MLFKITTTIKENRSAFGYSSSGRGDGGGKTNVFDAIELLNDLKHDADWTYPRWSGDVFIVEFEHKMGPDQYTKELTLLSESYAEFTLLKKWEQENGFL